MGEETSSDAPANAPWKQIENALRLRIRQQELLAEFGVLALKGTAFSELIDRAVLFTAEGLQAEFCKVLEYRPHDRRFLVRAGVGWGEDVVGKATVGADVDSPAGFALQTGRPVISNHLADEERFRTPELLLRYGIHRAMNVILQGEGEPYGVLEVDSRDGGEFSKYDLAFLQGVANILGMAIERQRMERDLKAALDRQQLLFKDVNHRVKNSLQLVTSMLNLQAQSMAEHSSQAPLREASARIAAIARAHERMSIGDSIRVIDLGAYLSAIGHDLDRSAGQCRIGVDAQQGIAIETDHAIPLALIVNELVTNAAKHARPDSGLCSVQVSAFRGAGDEVIISVTDNGKGLPAEFDLESPRTFGMRIVTALAGQIGAAIEAHRRDIGTAFVLKYPLSQPL